MFFAVLLGLLLTVNLNAQNPVKIVIDAASEKKAISPLIYGKNNSLSDWIGNPINAAEWQKLQDAGITLFRESGGNNSTKYNWRRKLSSHPDWYNNVYKHDWDYAAASLQQHIPNAQGMWSFQLIGKAAKTNSANFNDWGYNGSKWWSGVNQNLAGGGIVNPAGGSEAKKDGNPNLYLEDWPADSTVAILGHWFNAGSLDLDSTKICYWGMDNEPEIWSGTHDDVMPKQISAEEFMQRYFEVAKKARAKFPGIKLCGPVPANEWQWYNWDGDAISYKGKKYVWLEYFIMRVAEEQQASGIRLLDVLDIHFYPGETKGEDIVQLHRVYFDKNYVYPGANGVHRIGGGWNANINNEYIFGRCAEWLTKYLGNEHGVTFGVSETGIDSDDANVSATWYASTLGEFAKNSVEFFTPWTWENGMFEVLHLFSRYAQSFFVDGVSDQEEFVSAYPTFNEHRDSMTLFLVNRHTSQSKSLQIDIQNFTVQSNSTFYSLANLPNKETFVSHTKNALQISELQTTVYPISVEIKPLSVNALVLKAAPNHSSVRANNEFSLNVYPNPCSSEIYLDFALNHSERIRIHLFNSNGQPITALNNGEMQSGKHQLRFDLSAYPQGIYWISIQSNQYKQTKKVIVHHY